MYRAHEGLLSVVLKLALSFAYRLNVSMETTSVSVKYRGTLNLVDCLTNLDTTLAYHVSEVTVKFKINVLLALAVQTIGCR